jgi:glutathione S-transferase
MANLQIIGIPQSTYTRVVRMVAHEKGAPYDLVVAPPHSPDVKSIHPAGKVPVMRHGKHEMFESSAIESPNFQNNNWFQYRLSFLKVKL